MRHIMPVTQARQQLGVISRTTFYALVNEGELSLVKDRQPFLGSTDDWHGIGVTYGNRRQSAA